MRDKKRSKVSPPNKNWQKDRVRSESETRQDRLKELTERKRFLLAEVANYEKQDFGDWPDGKKMLELVRIDLHKVDDELDRRLKKE